MAGLLTLSDIPYAEQCKVKNTAGMCFARAWVVFVDFLHVSMACTKPIIWEYVSMLVSILISLAPPLENIRLKFCVFVIKWAACAASPGKLHQQPA